MLRRNIKIFVILVMVLNIFIFYDFCKTEYISTSYDSKYDEGFSQEYYHIEDLEKLLEDSNLDNIYIKLDDKNNILSSEDLDKIKESKKIVDFNYYENNKILYTFIIDGSKLNKTFDFNFELSYDSEYKNEISDINDYDLYIHFDYINVPEGTKFKIYVGDSFSNSDSLDIYYYDDIKKEVSELSNDVEVKNNFVEFDLNRYTDYLIDTHKTNVEDEETEINIPYEMTPLITTVITVIIIVVIVAVRLFKYAKNGKNNR